MHIFILNLRQGVMTVYFLEFLEGISRRNDAVNNFTLFK